MLPNSTTITKIKCGFNDMNALYQESNINRTQNSDIHFYFIIKGPVFIILLIIFSNPKQYPKLLAAF